MHDREIEQVIATKQPIRGEVPFTGTHGRRIYDYIFVPVIGADGEVEAIAGTTRDVTERKQAEEATRAAAERFRFLAESMPQKIFTAKPNGEVDYFNQQWTEFTGLPFEQIKGWGWTQFVHSEDVDENVRVWQHSIHTGEPFGFEHRFRRHDGIYRWHISRAHPMRDAKGNVIMWIGSDTDIDDQKLAQEQLQRLIVREQAARVEAESANRMKDEFLAVPAGS
jgi:PAS domain S-box-containing protein